MSLCCPCVRYKPGFASAFTSLSIFKRVPWHSKRLPNRSRIKMDHQNCSGHNKKKHKFTKQISWSYVIFTDPNPWPCSRWLAIHGSLLSLNKPLDTVVMFAPGTVEHCYCSSLSIRKTDCYICYTVLHIFLFHSKT